jgi:hypothetical protein
MNTEELVSNRIHSSRVVFQDAVSGMYEVASVYEIRLVRCVVQVLLIILLAISI